MTNTRFREGLFLKDEELGKEQGGAAGRLPGGILSLTSKFRMERLGGAERFCDLVLMVFTRLCAFVKVQELYTKKCEFCRM